MSDVSHLYDENGSGAVYDQCRRGHRDVIEEIMRMFPLPQDGQILDAGCGTGNESVLLQTLAGRPIWCCDRSMDMLHAAKAKLKNGRRAVLGDFEHLRAFGDRKFAYVFSSFTYHHARSHEQFFREMFRILRPSGRFVLLCGTLEQESEKPLVLFFPSLKCIDARRYLSLEKLIEVFWSSGFVGVEHKSIYFETRRTDCKYLERVKKGKVDSSLSLVPRPEWRKGIRAFEAQTGSPKIFDIYRTVISGIRPVHLGKKTITQGIAGKPPMTGREMQIRRLPGGIMNKVIRVMGDSATRVLKQGTVLTSRRSADGTLQSMSPERTADEYKAMRALNESMRSSPVRVPRVYNFDAANNVITMEDVSDGHIGMWRLSKNAFARWEPDIAATMGEFMALQHLSFRNHQVFLRGDAGRDFGKWKWMFRLRTTELARRSSPVSGDRYRSALDSKAEEILGSRVVNTLVNADICPKNIFVSESDGTLTAFDFEFCSGVGDPMYDVGFFLGHLIIYSFLHRKRFSSGAALACLDRYRETNPAYFRGHDVTWYAALTIMYRVWGASPLRRFQKRCDRRRIGAVGRKIVERGGGDIEVFVAHLNAPR